MSPDEAERHNVELAKFLLGGITRPDLIELVARIEREEPGALEELGPFLAFLDEEIVWDVSALRMPDVGVLRGVQEVIGFWIRWLAEWEEFSFEIENMEGVGEFVLYDVVMHARGRRGAVPVDMSMSQTMRFRGERLVEMTVFTSRDSAELATWRARP
jgi:hypothetical protein